MSPTSGFLIANVWFYYHPITPSEFVVSFLKLLCIFYKSIDKHNNKYSTIAHGFNRGL